MGELYRTKIAGVGSYLPEGVLTNFDLEKMVDTNNQWILERTGIERRHMASQDQACSDLAAIAIKRALEDAQMSPQDIDVLIVATVSGDQVMPSTACVLQKSLGCRNIMAFDLSAACSGFVYSLSIADSFIRSGFAKNVVVVGSELLHRIVNYKDRETCILFGDGAGAFVFTRANPEDKNIIYSSHLHADGSLGELFVLPAGGSKIPFSAEVLEKGQQYVVMKGKEIFRHAVRTLSASCEEALQANGFTADQLDWIVPHQANSRILNAVADHFKFPHEKVISEIHETGNTSAASIPLAFDLARQKGKIKRGQLILFTAFGAGLTSGSALLRY